MVSHAILVATRISRAKRRGLLNLSPLQRARLCNQFAHSIAPIGRRKSIASVTVHLGTQVTAANPNFPSASQPTGKRIVLCQVTRGRSQ